MAERSDRTTSDDTNDHHTPETGDRATVVESYSGISFRRPHIFNRAERANLDIEQMHLCAFEVGA